MQGLIDQLGRPIRDLRISVTDRCNFRCGYCMPKEVFNSKYQFLARDDLLSFEEISRVAALFAKQGVRKIRLTGGEPLLRKNLEVLVAELASIDGIEDISLTTNASILTLDKAKALKEAGLHRITVSLDALDDPTFKKMNAMDVPVSQVLEGIDNAQAAGLGPVKVNAVICKGVNDHAVLQMAKHFHGSGHILRFIEYMDVGTTNGWQMDQVISGAEMVDIIDAELPIEPVDANYTGEVAKRWRYKDGGGEVGFITSVTQSFCHDCTRARLSAEGSVYTCLFASKGTDLRRLLREGASDEYLSEVLSSLWRSRNDRYSEIRSSDTILKPKVEMSYIGG